MSNHNKLTWLVLIMLLGCIGWLVVVDMTRSGALERFEVKDDCRGCTLVSGRVLQPAKQVQKTQSSAQLHKLSTGVEITPLEMLRSGQLVAEYDGLSCVRNCTALERLNK